MKILTKMGGKLLLYLTMRKVNSSSIEVSADPENMRTRKFSVPNVRTLPRAILTARELEKNDSSLAIENIGLLDVVLSVTDSSDWMASSGEQLGIERQTYVLRRLGEACIY